MNRRATPELVAHDDPGLQPERTLLAWRRTLMTLVVACTLFLRWIPQFGILAVLPIVVALIVSLGIQVGLRWRYRRSITGIREERLSAPLLEIALLGAGVGGLSLYGIYAVAFF